MAVAAHRHPVLTLLTIIITANHYWLDAFVALVIFTTCTTLTMWRKRVTDGRAPASDHYDAQRASELPRGECFPVWQADHQLL